MNFDVLGWFVIAMSVLGVAATILSVGKPRPPVTGTLALLTLIFAAFNIWIVYGLIQGW